MARTIRIVTSSFATLEDERPPFNLRYPDPQENMALAQSILAQAVAFHPDLVVLPETFITAGMPISQMIQLAEPLDGPAFSMLSSFCRDGRFNLVAGMPIRYGEQVRNQALVIDRVGQLVGTYTKNYPGESEIDCGVTPGQGNSVFNLDFGRIEVAICFDIHYPELWTTFHQQKIDLACWISAFEGGFPLKSLAWVNRFPIVSSVYPFDARVIDMTGEVLASTTRWSRVAFYELNLDRVLCHTDLQMDRIAKIQTKYGSGVTVKTYTEEQLMLVENNLPNVSIQDIIQEFSLTSYDDYLLRCSRYRSAHLK